MGNWYQSWTNCCTNVNSWFSDNSVNWYTALIGVVGVLVGVGVGGVTAALIPGAATALAILCLAGVYYCNWWLNIRLICLGGDRSAIGAIFNIEPPTPSLDFLNLGDYDTDYSFNLLIYPALPLDMLPNWFVDNFSPPTSPTPWQLSPITQLQAQWPTLFPFISWDDANLILPQQGTMGSLGLGFTGQYASSPGSSSALPFVSIIVAPSDQSITNGSTLQLKATGYRADGSYQDLTQGPNAATWTSSGPAATISTGGLVTATTNASLNTTVFITATYGSGAASVSGAATVKVVAGTTVAAGPWEQILIHCEIEGRGMEDLRTLLWALFGTFTTAAVLSFFPPIGTAISIFLLLLALLALLFGGPAIQNDDAGPPNPPGSPQGGDGWGGYAYVDAPTTGSLVDLVYVCGRWVFDSLHQPVGSNELHPVHYIVKVGSVPMGGLTTGDWGIDLESMKTKLDQQYSIINMPSTVNIQSKPENQWSLHPLIDGCQGQASYAPPATPPPPK